MCAEAAFPIPSETYFGILTQGRGLPVYMKAFGRVSSSFSHPTTASRAAAHKPIVLTLKSRASAAALIPDRISSSSVAGVRA